MSECGSRDAKAEPSGRREPEPGGLTAERRSSEEISRMAQEQGMWTLRQDGILKVLDGKTSVEELLRVIV